MVGLSGCRATYRSVPNTVTADPTTGPHSRATISASERARFQRASGEIKKLIEACRSKGLIVDFSHGSSKRVKR
jgi:hypothetical protein